MVKFSPGNNNPSLAVAPGVLSLAGSSIPHFAVRGPTLAGKLRISNNSLKNKLGTLLIDWSGRRGKELLLFVLEVKRAAQMLIVRAPK